MLGFAYLAVLLSIIGVDGEERELTLFIFGALLLPFLCAAFQLFFVRPNFLERLAGPIESINCWIAVVLLLGLAALPLVIYVVGMPGEFWLENVKFVIVTVAALHERWHAFDALSNVRPCRQATKRLLTNPTKTDLELKSCCDNRTRLQFAMTNAKSFTMAIDNFIVAH